MTGGDAGAEPRNILRVVAAVITDGHSVLACRRRPEKAAGGKWEFPGGKVEAGENDVGALRREIREELGADIAVGELLSSDDTEVAGRVIRLVCFRASLAGPAPTHSSDHDQLVWLSVPDLQDLDWAEPDLPALNRLLRDRLVSPRGCPNI